MEGFIIVAVVVLIVYSSIKQLSDEIDRDKENYRKHIEEMEYWENIRNEKDK